MASKIGFYQAVPPELQARFPEWERLALVLGLDKALLRCCTEALSHIGAEAMSGAPGLMKRRGASWVTFVRERGIRAGFIRVIAESVAYEIYTSPAPERNARGDRLNGVGNVTRVKQLPGGPIAMAPSHGGRIGPSSHPPAADASANVQKRQGGLRLLAGAPAAPPVVPNNVLLLRPDIKVHA